MRNLLRIVIAMAGLYALLCAGLFLFQRQLIFHPDERSVTLNVGELTGASVVALTTADNEQLLGWWVPPRDSSYPVYLYLPGNAETLADRLQRFVLLTQDGAGLLAVSWRGYGGSTGEPSEAGLQLDAMAAYDWLISQAKPEQVIVFGESVGSGVAVRLTAAQVSGALVLDAAYPSLLQVAEWRLPWLPVRSLLRETFDVQGVAPQVTVPVLQRHCMRDSVLPYALAQQLFARFGSSDKQWISVDDGCHLPALTPLRDDLRRLEQLLRRVVA